MGVSIRGARPISSRGQAGASEDAAAESRVGPAVLLPHTQQRRVEIHVRATRYLPTELPVSPDRPRESV